MGGSHRRLWERGGGAGRGEGGLERRRPKDSTRLQVNVNVNLHNLLAILVLIISQEPPRSGAGAWDKTIGWHRSPREVWLTI